MVIEKNSKYIRIQRRIVFLLFILVVSPVVGQVYNYIPIVHSDFETNPSILASSDLTINRVQLIHQNSFSASNPFSMSTLRISKYFKSSFTGIGLTLNNTNYRSNNGYNHVGLSMGYRNILFNTFFIKIGATYKLINTHSPVDVFDGYLPISKDTLKNRFNSSLNLSFALSTNADRYYISFGLLNRQLPWDRAANSVQFPQYYVMNIGNLMSLFRKENSEISYTAFIKKSVIDNSQTFSQYINLKWNLRFSRNTMIPYGARIGYAENSFYQISPFVGLYNYNHRLMISLSENVYLQKHSFHTKYNSTSQLNLNYFLDKPRKRRVPSHPTF